MGDNDLRGVEGADEKREALEDETGDNLERALGEGVWGEAVVFTDKGDLRHDNCGVNAGVRASRGLELMVRPCI